MKGVVGPRLLHLSAGQVRLSDRRSQRTWTEGVGPFAIADCPVTAALYFSVESLDTGAGSRPVIDVTWWDPVRFCNALSARDGLALAYVVDELGEHVDWDRSADG